MKTAANGLAALLVISSLTALGIGAARLSRQTPSPIANIGSTPYPLGYDLLNGKLFEK